MKTISAKTRKIMAYLDKNPQAKVTDVAKKFGVHISRIYAVRKRMQADFIRDVLGVPAETTAPTAESEFPEDPTPMPPLEHEAESRAQMAIREAKLTAADRMANRARFFDIVKQSPTVDVNKVLDSRAVDYGKFKDGARLMQGMKRLMADHAQAQGKTFADDQWEALEMIVHKIGRIVNGNSDKVDHWTDIAGYATLVADRLEGRVR